MTFPKYPEYKDSGVEWLGEVPAHWSVVKFVRCARIAEGQVDPRDQPYRSMKLVAPNHIESATGRLMVLETAEEQGAESGKYYCQAGDVLYSKIRPALRKAVIVYEDCLCSADMYPLRAQDGVRGEYLLWMILSDSFSTLAVLESERVAMPKINRESINEIRIPVPPVLEQVVISRMVDHETARIDALIAEQQRLIELLKEKRQAVISHAVTKGLDPEVPMKDSGVEWLGELPAHWQVKRLKHITSAIGGSTPSKDRPEFWDGSIPWVSPKDMKVKVINQTIDQITEEAVLENNLSLADPGMVLVVVRGMILAHSLPLAITASKVALNQDMKALKTEKFMDSEYLFDLLSGIKDVAFEFVDSSAHGTRRLEWERFREILLPIPPLSEQRELSYRINAAKGQIDQLSQEAQNAIGHLQERRSALISATVTGKIDVRDWQPPTSAAFAEATVSEGATA